ncbi:GSCFA domain-containing protein [Marinoscillum sp. MHG1-6]|uniref:GSCFA domain-containing protein n=1 Tax=Marinoscillum sp. MHG1-6 TaxID=2959627 RepID=UPI002157700E|nr:GSCFA domain-containing protein [Marinoscillum sp. MHG1-6]
MTTFRTELFIDENPDKIEYSSKILSFGSGFSNILTSHFEKYRFQVKSNPYGNIYNPISIFDAIEFTSKNESVDKSRITETDGVYGHFDFHSKMNSTSEDQLTKQLDATIQETNNYFKKTDFLFLTFGSAYAFRHNESHKIVANCHRAPQNEFTKVLLSPEEIVTGFKQIYKSMNHIKNIVLVVSPIMHTGDSITLNAVSKSILRLACHQIMSEFPYVRYFPAYEFLLSDLRDYRFYEKDLIHPTEQAMDYIFEKLVEAYVHEDSKKLIAEVETILDTIEHVPYTPQNNKYQIHLQKALDKINMLENQIDLSSFKEELEMRTS